MKDSYNIKTLLEIIFKVTKKNTKILADQYLLKDVSIISKWRNNVVLPRNYDIYKIVQFVNNEATSSQKGIIRNSIEELLVKAPIQSNLRDIILNSEDFGEFLKEALSVSISAPDPNNDVIYSEKDENVKSIIKKGPEATRNEGYTGMVELDFIVPEGGNVNLQNLSGATGIEFKGRVNLTPRKKVLQAANIFKSRSVLGILVLGVFAAVAFSFYNLPRKDIRVLNAKNSEVLNTPTTIPTVSPSPTSFATQVPTSVPTAVCTPIPEKKEDKNTSTGGQGSYKQKTYNKTKNVTKNVNKNTTSNITNNVTNNVTNNTTNNVNNNITNNNTTNNVTNNVTNNININGENQTTIVGNNNAVGFECE